MLITRETNRPMLIELDYRPRPRNSFPKNCACGSLPDYLCVDSNTVTVAKCWRCAEAWAREKGIGERMAA